MAEAKKLSNAEDYDDGCAQVQLSAPVAGQGGAKSVLTQVVEMDTGITATFSGLKSDASKALLRYHLPGICTLGLWYLFNAWFLSFYVWLTMSACPIAEAEWIWCKNDEDTMDLRQVKRTFTIDGQVVRYFTYRYVRFVFSSEERKYVVWNVGELIRRDSPTKGLAASMVGDRRALVGVNGYDIETKPWYLILFDGILNPFNVFQVFAAVIWWVQKQAPYAMSILLLSAYAVISSLLETLRSYRRLKEMAYFSCPVTILRDGAWLAQVPSESLVPGDVFEIDPDMEVLPCDALLVSGEVLLNESMLTGESIPVVRKSIPAGAPLAAHLDDKGSILYAGTRVMRVRGGASRRTLALAIRTGFDTYKGFLIRQIMFPPPLKFKFYQDSIVYMEFLCVLAAVALLYTFLMASSFAENSPIDIFMKCADLLTIAVPPALPTVLSVGVSVAIGRLKKAAISTTFPAKLNICGRLDVFCFDKTGTLTEEGLDICAVVGTRARDRPDDESSIESASDTEDEDVLRQQSINRRSGAAVALAAETANALRDFTGLAPVEDSESDGESTCSEEVRVFSEPVIDPIDLSDKFFHLLSCCHTVTYVHGRLVGDPLDLKMFEFTGCVLEEPDHSVDDANVAGTTVRPFEGSGNELKIIRSFPFEASLKRQSVLIRDVLEESYEFYTKGAPEVIRDHCRPSSIPSDFDDLLGSYASHGQRVVACAYKRMPEDIDAVFGLPRAEIESDLIFLGFIVFENKLKEESPVAIATLARARIRSVMVTGDNVLTAINVARKCGIVSEECQMFFPVSDSVGPHGEVKFVNVEDSSEWLTDLPSFLLHHNPTGRRSAPDVQVALTGRIFSQLKERYSWPLFSALLSRCNIYARMSPLEKHELVEELQELDHCVAMVGDGANDCGALRIADVGVSLSETEASLAAPFNSCIATIACAPLIVREGRAALVTSFSSFKYMSLYSFVQLTTACLLLLCNGVMNASQFIAFDMFTVLFLGSALTFAGAKDTLDPERPTSSLISTPVIGSITLQAVVQIVFQLVARFALPTTHAFAKSAVTRERNLYFNTVLVMASAFQYIWTALICGIGGKYRSPLFHNYRFVCWAAVLTLVYAAIFLTNCIDYPGDEIVANEEGYEKYLEAQGHIAAFFIELVPLRIDWYTRLWIVLLALLNLAASVVAELVVLPMIVYGVSAAKGMFWKAPPSRRDQLASYTIDDLEKSDLPTRPNVHRKLPLKKF